MEDIKPIDKFTLDKYVKEEDDLLEYVEMVRKVVESEERENENAE